MPQKHLFSHCVGSLGLLHHKSNRKYVGPEMHVTVGRQSSPGLLCFWIHEWGAFLSLLSGCLSKGVCGWMVTQDSVSLGTRAGYVSWPEWKIWVPPDESFLSWCLPSNHVYKFHLSFVTTQENAGSSSASFVFYPGAPQYLSTPIKLSGSLPSLKWEKDHTKLFKNVLDSLVHVYNEF